MDDVNIQQIVYISGWYMWMSFAFFSRQLRLKQELNSMAVD